VRTLWESVGALADDCQVEQTTCIDESIDMMNTNDTDALTEADLIAWADGCEIGAPYDHYDDSLCSLIAATATLRENEAGLDSDHSLSWLRLYTTRCT
jgi:hypothetical protein